MSANIGAEPRRWPERIAGSLYDAAWTIVFAFAAVLASLGRRWWKEKSGEYSFRNDADPHVWVHACSVGEVNVALLFIRALAERRPEISFTLSTVTPEGHTFAKQRLGTDSSRVVFFPFDSRHAMRRAFDRLRPDFIILCEAELWPNHLREAAARKIPVFVVNGRLTGADERNYRRAGAFMRRVFAVPELVCARGSADAQRFTRLGAGNVLVTGDIKFDQNASTDAPVGVAETKRPVLLGASTHEGEERILLGVARILKATIPNLLLVLVPRHPQRAGKIARLARGQGFTVSLSSVGGEHTDCRIVDSVGQLADWYGKATLCFVGKSLTARGGQNFLEAAAAGCPVIAGPHLGNFAEAAALFLQAQAMVQVRDENELSQEVARLFSDDGTRARMASAARRILEQNRGASERVADAVLANLGKRV